MKKPKATLLKKMLGKEPLKGLNPISGVIKLLSKKSKKRGPK